MADSEKVKKEEVDQIGSVLQLNPHQKNTQFANVKKPKDGEMVSLDELYENTGQEAINKFLEGFEQLTKSNKLSRAHGAALKVNGFENWLVLSDELNAYRGGENFLNAIKRGIVAIVKAIIAFVKGLADWVYVRIKSLLGFDKTIKETIFLNKRSEEMKEAVLKFFKTLGIPHFDEAEFLEGLPNNVTTRDIFTITKRKLDGNTAALKALGDVSKYMKDYVKVINSCNDNIKSAKRTYDGLMDQLKRKVKNDTVTLYDIGELTVELNNIMEQKLSTQDIATYLDNMLEYLYKVNIDIEGLGQKNNFKEMKEQIKAVSAQAKLEFSTESYENAHKIAQGLYKGLFKDGAGYNAAKLDPTIVKNLKQFINESNSTYIQRVGEQYPNSDISPTYIKFCNKITQYSNLVESVLQIAQRVESSITSVIKWNTHLNDLITTRIIKDIVDVAKVHNKIHPKVIENMDKILGWEARELQKYYVENPKFTVTEFISEIAAGILSTPEMADYLSRLKYSLLGR